MKIKNTGKKQKAAMCLVATMTLPFLLGFKIGENETTEGADSQYTERPVDDTRGNSDTQYTDRPADDTRGNSDSPKYTEKPFDAPADTPKIGTNTPGGEFSIGEDKRSTYQPGTGSDNTRRLQIQGYEPPTEPEGDTQTEERMREYMQQFNGKTIVEIFYEGASDATLPTVKSAVHSHVGDEFNADAALRDRNAINETGYFYEAYPTFQEVPEGVMITYHMLENPVLKEVQVTGNTVLKEEEINKLITLQTGEILNSNTLHDNMAAIQEKYRGDGYILMKISDMHIDNDGVLTLKINEGILEGYSVKGNKKTKDYVITREMRQKPGQPFNAKLARRSMERVYNLGFFEDVNVKMNPGVEPNAVVMEIDVKEKRTGTFGLGAGYNAMEGLVGVLSISERNYRGTGQSLYFAIEKSARYTDARGFSFNYRRPWLDRHETALTLRIYNRTYQYYDYGTDGNLKERYMRRYAGGEITVSRPVSEYSTNYITFKNRKDKYVRHISPGTAGDRSGLAGQAWRDENFGLTRSITFNHVTDTRDNIYDPTRGGRVSISAEFGGWFGGDFKFQKYSIDHSKYVRAGHAQVWAMRAAYGLGYGDLTEFNQFRIGGQGNLRGYRDDQFRGNRMLLASLEYRFPFTKRIQGIVFTDWGSAWNGGMLPKGGDIYGSLGLGVAVNTPFGPLRLDYGRGKQGGRFHFSIGGSF